jgi:hypothetical protein
MLHLYAALAEKERAMISARTKAALAAAKAKGTVLGNPRLAEVAGRGVASKQGRRGRVCGKSASSHPADEDRGEDLRLPQSHPVSLREIAALNERRIPTARGGKWAQTQVADILKRAG